ncbi:hypothetical protein ACIPC1_16590 [Streptomyces sp. NPDC087263]|uniref:hypothetical protein n=1 Tax=Streptomyces sp. NPDC087263 TaxID=3365773 RepID=UPI00380917B0
MVVLAPPPGDPLVVVSWRPPDGSLEGMDTTTAVRIRSLRRDHGAVNALDVLAPPRELVEGEGRTAAVVTHDPVAPSAAEIAAHRARPAGATC